MKRILAVFLTLAMALNIAPMAAFAAADSDVASIVAVEETDESSSSQLDGETVRAIVSDPFLLAAYAQTEQEQTGQAEVDTSNMSVSATNSFGQLLVNGMGMDGENGSDLSSESRIIEITMNGSTARVKYIAKKDANLVVGIYTDDSEQEMIASGTVAVQATPDNTASSIVEVPLSGEVPEHYTMKGFLLDKEDHAPLCREYTNAFYTENVEELEGATIDDFDSARAINLDDDRTTNFGVVKQGVILLQEDELENGAGENIVVLDDSENQIYQIENASTELLNLKQGNIIVYKYGENNLIIAHVADFEINGTTVTIYGDEDFQLEDVFSILKMDGENTTDEAIVDTETGDGKVSYIGTQEIETLDSTNEWEGKAEFSHVFKISTDDGKDEDSEEKPVSGSVEGTVSIKAAIKLKLRLCDDNKMVSMSFPMTEKFELEGSVEYKGEVLKFPKITLPVYGCLSVGFEPQMVFKANASVAFKMESTQMIGFEWSQKDGTQDISEAPVTSINFKLSGSIYLGFDMAPKAELGVGKVSLIKLKFKAEAGFELSAEERLGNQGTGRDEIHGCKNCYEGELEFKLTLGVGLKILLYEPKIEITPFSHSFGKAYASADYGDFGWGECPHVKYRLTLKAGKAGAGATVKIQSNDSDTSSLYTETILDTDGNSTVYLPGREYRIIVNKGSMEFVKPIKLSRGTTINIDLEQGSTGGNPGTTEPDTPDAPTNPDIPTGGTVVASGSCGAKGDNLTWTLDDNGLLTISGTGAMASDCRWSASGVDYSNSIKYVWIKNGVTSIGSFAFKETNLKIVEIPDSVTSIDEHAFDRCTHLQEITLPESITRIDQYAFANCTSLRKITIPKNVRGMGLGLFAGCTGLVSAEIMDGVPAIGDSMFNGCTNLRSVTIPESVANIGMQAFQNCAGLSNVVIPKGVRSISDYAFKDCTNLARLTLPDGLSSIGREAFINCTSLRNVTLPESVINVGTRAFYNCSSLSSVTIPEGVLQIEREAFALCGKLAAVAVPGTVTEIGEGAFKNCVGLKKAEIADGVLSIGREAFINCISLTDLVLPESITSIGDSAFRECSSLTRMTIPENLSNTGTNAFNGCRSLSEVTILDGVTSIGDGAFAGCRSLKRVVIPDSVQIIGYDAFYYCTNLAELDFPDGLQRIGGRAFYGCIRLKEISLPDSVTRMEDEAFRECSSLTSAVLPAGLTRISYNAFRGCVGLTNITIPANVKTVDSGAFGACSRLTSVSLPNGLTTIENGAFSGCVNLKEISIPESVTEIRGSAFEDCFNLKNVEIPGKVTDIGESTFRGCRKLKSVSIPQSVNGIREYAFYECDSLKYVYYSGTKNEWNSISIFSNGNDRLSAATIHCTDGDILPTSTASENSITTGTASASGSKFQAAFADAKAGKEYVVLVSRSGSDPLNADNLIYINQITADADGELAVPFITAADAAEMTYVVACAQDGAPVDPGQPDQPGGDEPSSGGDGGGAAIILIGGVAAVAAVAGVVLLMPVKVEGTVKLADQPVANATVQVLKGDAVKAETVTDANGHFTVKVKRGGYTLRVQWTDASGQPVTRTVDFKAPNANLNVAA